LAIGPFWHWAEVWRPSLRPIDHVSKPLSSVFYTLIYFIRPAVPKEYIPVLPSHSGKIYKGKKRPHLVLAFPMPLDKRMRFEDRYKLDVDLLPRQRHISAQIYIHEHIAEHRRNVTSVQYEPEKWDLAWAVAANKAQKDLKYALRVDEIKYLLYYYDQFGRHASQA